MGEIKSVKVDNWGVFFLQKLQNFFNKTDYCDLTLQFNDNSQLKVHRLVLSACTDYFNVLEQTCEMIEDVLIMPLELQADVVVPIVNFMYTGTLEFELRMYGKLLKTARDMNMTVLLKLLEAHRRTMERNPTQPTNRNTARNSYQKKLPVVPGTSGSNATQRRVQTSNASTYKSIQIKPISSYFQGTNATQNIQTKYAPARVVKGPSRFDYPPEGKVLPPETFEQSFDTISYESKPLICKEEPDSEDYENLVQKSSPFEELRRGYNNNKRPASSVSLSSFESPPEKKPNIEDVKEYAEQQRVRKQIAQEYDDDNEYDETLDDEYHNDDDDEDYVPPQSYQKQAKQPSQQKQTQQKQTQQKNIQQQTPIVIKQENNRPTIVVKDSPNSNVNHAKIISEVLRKYPHLVKNNKNIKLKILPKSTNTGKNETQKIVLKKESIDQRPVAVPSLPPPSTKHATYPSAVQRSSATAGTSLLQQKTTQQSKANPVKSTTSTASTASSSTASTSTQPRRIDSKTMHSLIAMGAENRTGPWLCLECGVNGRPISIPSYRGFRRHLINTHGQSIDPRLCEHCGWRSTNNRELNHHMLVEHKIKPPSTFNFPKCELCDAVLLSYSELEKHISENHEEGIEVNQNCIYCNRTFANEGFLYAHMKSQHKERAKEDGVIDFSDDENAFESDSQYQSDGGHDQKIKILSDISLPKNIPIIEAEDNAPGTTITLPPEALETNARLIDASQGPRFVNADGKEMELTEEQRREIIAQLENQDHGAVVMVLNDESINQDETQTTSELSTSASTSTQKIPKNDKSSKSQKESTVVEKDLHKPRKTKHTVRADVDDNEDSEDIIEWLDEESGNIMKVPLSKFSKMGDTEEEDEEDTARDTEEGESADEGAEDVKKAKDDESSSINDKNESQEDETTSDSVKDKKHDEEEEEQEEVEEEEEEQGEKEEDKTEKVKDKKPIGSKPIKETKSKDKGEMSKALETLKILTGDWTDEEDDDEQKQNEKKNVSNEKSKQTQNKEKENSKEEEILFETIAVAETSTEDVAKKDMKSRKSRSKSRESEINEKDDDTKNDKKIENKDGDKDDKDDSMDIDTSITTVHDDVDKLLKDVEDDATDDDMKIIEELKNYEAEQLAAEKEAMLKKEEKTVEERLLRRKSKSKSKSASPAISENGNQSGGSSDSNSGRGDKPKKRGRPKKTLNLEKQKSKNDSDEISEIVTEIKKDKDSDDENKEKKNESDLDDCSENEKDIAAKIKAQLETTDENSQGSTKKDEAEEEEAVVEEEEQDENDKNKSDEITTVATEEEEENEKDKIVADAIAETSELMTKAEIRNLISDWGDDEEDDEEL